MFYNFQPFGHEVRHLNSDITTATQKHYNLRGKHLTKLVIRIIGLPHFGARIRAFYLNKRIRKLPPKQYILDAGCGMGLNSFLAARAGHKVLGIDNDSEKIKLGKQMLKNMNIKSVRFKVEDLTKLSFKKEVFDAVFCFEVLEHIPKDTKAFSEIARVLKKGGTFLLSVPARGVISRINQESKDHVREGYSLDEIRGMCKKNKLEIENIIMIERTPLGFFVRYLNDEIGRRSLFFVTVFFPILLPLGILDGKMPVLIKPNNWIIVSKKVK